MGGEERAVKRFPRLLALFQKRIEGDDALLGLARLRFREAGLGMEGYADTPSEFEWLIGYRPAPDAPATVHLSRSIDLLGEEGRSRVLEFARSFRGRVYGLVVHDQREVATRFDDYVASVIELGNELQKIEESPHVFLEYASGLEPDLFAEMLCAVSGAPRVSGCIDTGHVGLWRVRKAFSLRHRGTDVCRLKPSDSDLPGRIEDVQEAVGSALEEVVRLVRRLGSTGKPLHFHLHDGHPLSTSSPFGVSDHMSFLTEIPIPFAYRGKRAVDLMFGPSGLEAIIAEAMQWLEPEDLSLSLEIHPTEGRIPLAGAAHLFEHWGDKGNAERMNYWLSVLVQNHLLVSALCERVRGAGREIRSSPPCLSSRGP